MNNCFTEKIKIFVDEYLENEQKTIDYKNIKKYTGLLVSEAYRLYCVENEVDSKNKQIILDELRKYCASLIAWKLDTKDKLKAIEYSTNYEKEINKIINGDTIECKFLKKDIAMYAEKNGFVSVSHIDDVTKEEYLIVTKSLNNKNDPILTKKCIKLFNEFSSTHKNNAM